MLRFHPIRRLRVASPDLGVDERVVVLLILVVTQKVQFVVFMAAGSRPIWADKEDLYVV